MQNLPLVFLIKKCSSDVLIRRRVLIYKNVIYKYYNPLTYSLYVNNTL